MDILNLAEKYTELKKVSSSEYAGPCPGCGGNDRFRVVTNSENGRYFCRNCEKKGDVIQFCTDFLGMSFKDACIATGNSHKLKTGPGNGSNYQVQIPKKERVKPFETSQEAQEGPDRDLWQSQAYRFTEWANKQLLARPELITWLETDRQLSSCQVDHHRLGFNPAPRFSEPEKWGFPPGKKVFLPAGLVIPYHDAAGKVYGINVRQFKPTDKAPPGYLPDKAPDNTYLRIKGTDSKPLILGDLARAWPVVIVESELDALALWLHFDCMVNVVALLSAARRPDLPGNGPILYALDFDEPGKKRFKAWAEKYPGRVYPAAPIRGKDITDMLKTGVPPLTWLALKLDEAGLLTSAALNPYAHFCLVDAIGQLPEQIREQARRPDFALHLWTAAYGLDSDGEAMAQAGYLRAFKYV